MLWDIFLLIPDIVLRPFLLCLCVVARCRWVKVDGNARLSGTPVAKFR